MAERGRVLGAVLAGGASRRFGSDKALATIDGRPLIDHAIAALRPVAHAIAVCGRHWPAILSLPDLRAERVGPLGGIEAALHHAHADGFTGVLVVPVDTHPLDPIGLEKLSKKGLAVCQDQFAIGYWPVATADAVSAYLDGGGRSLRGLLTGLDAAFVGWTQPLTNYNYCDDQKREARPAAATSLSRVPSR